mmetsp:Transcript_35815/g.49707  ORF Transcript_35815/g.49707 Transcript_35815/m.49707 type:complete len:356 (+) Transcript_35815:122-1189(+)|eukprot:CAMPEP_0196583352 /NCGR_PEP_ID=MMETSP1081-20130531/43186_1 /TAXON_ID=36882 /ORGANISM="Pyramimonas amylifera, Strain CCMP720" /LENGTH=355 /DNA_ID=CAMNT_0041904217 /DNA_START=115 /DNA_END=1182 /DNA_ORIENTATION=+
MIALESTSFMNRTCVAAQTSHLAANKKYGNIGQIKSTRSVFGKNKKSHKISCNIVKSENPSVVDRVLQVFTTPADTLNEGIASFYDESSGLWEDMWGEHMHHGYYEVGVPVKDHQEAQVDMIDNALKWACVDGVESMLDVGCGIGGSSRHIARKFGCKAKGITLSPRQAARANAISQEAGLQDVSFQVADALNQPFEDNSFDFVWSMESGEHMPDKDKFVGELARVCKPGGRILIVTWCHRVLKEGETELKPDEQSLLRNICDAYYLPAWCSIADYARIAEETGLRDMKTEDWSDEVQPFWGAVIQTALTPQGFFGLLKAGAGTLRGALVMPLMKTGLVKGTIKFNLITATKPLN